jgi:type I restriction enzyme M protein
MNMILHGIEAPNIVHTNTLAENLADVQDKDRFDVILANPPFGGKERKEVQQNFPIRTGETAFLFLQHFIKMLKAGGRAGVVIKNTFLSTPTTPRSACASCCWKVATCTPSSTAPAAPSRARASRPSCCSSRRARRRASIWYYQLDPGRNLGKTNPLNDADLAEFVELQKTFADSPKSWSVKVGAGDTATYDLSVKNPNGNEAVAHRSPQDIMDEIAALDAESAEVLANIRALL